MVDPLSTTRTKFATLKGRGAHVEDEAIMVVSVPAVHPLHVGGGLLAVLPVCLFGGGADLQRALEFLVALGRLLAREHADRQRR